MSFYTKIFLLSMFMIAASFNAASISMEFVEPVDSTQTSHDSWTDPIDFIIDEVGLLTTASNFGTSSDICVYEKELAETSFTAGAYGCHTVWSDEDNSAIPYAQSWNPDEGELNFNLSKGDSKTIVCDGKEHTIEVEYMGAPANDDVQYLLDGINKTRDEGSVDDFNCDGGPDLSGEQGAYLHIQEVDPGNDNVTFHIYPPSDEKAYREYRLVSDPGTGSEVRDDIVKLSFAKGGNEVPFPELLGANGSFIAEGNTLTGVSANSTIKIKVKDYDGNSLNVELIDNSDSSIVGTKNSVSSGSWANFSTVNDDILNQKDTSYDFYVNISDGTVTRSSLLTTFNTSTEAESPEAGGGGGGGSTGITANIGGVTTYVWAGQ